jgi:hypothetical protein
LGLVSLQDTAPQRLHDRLHTHQLPDLLAPKKEGHRPSKGDNCGSIVNAGIGKSTGHKP